MEDIGDRVYDNMYLCKVNLHKSMHAGQQITYNIKKENCRFNFRI
jgi:hypothetical protein